MTYSHDPEASVASQRGPEESIGVEDEQVRRHGRQAFDIDIPVQRPIGCNHERMGFSDRVERILVPYDRQIVRKPGGGWIVHVHSGSLTDEPAAQFNR